MMAYLTKQSQVNPWRIKLEGTDTRLRAGHTTTVGKILYNDPPCTVQGLLSPVNSGIMTEFYAVYTLASYEEVIIHPLTAWCHSFVEPEITEIT